MITREDYLAQRETLFNAVVAAVDSEETLYEAAKKEYEDFEKAYKNACERQASIEALKGEYANSAATQVFGTTLIAKSGEDFENLFCDALRGNVQAQEKYKNTVISGANTGFLIPAVLSDKLSSTIKKQSSIYADLQPYYVPGVLTLAIDDDIDAVAGTVTVGTDLADSDAVLVNVQLTLETIGKQIPIGKDITTMTNAGIINGIVEKLAKKVVQGVAYKVVNAPHNAAGIKGVVSKLTATYVTNVVACTAGSLFTYLKLASAIGKLSGSAVQNAVIYGNGETIFSHLAMLTDTTGKPLFNAVALPESNIVGYICGRPVKLDAFVPANTLLLGDFANCYGLNIAQDLTLDIEEAKRRFTNYYIGSMQVGGAPLDVRGFSLVTGTNFLA